MLDILVFVHRDASLERHDEIARELQAVGFKLKASFASVGVIAGLVEDRGTLGRIQKIKDVTAVQEVGAPPPSGD